MMYKKVRKELPEYLIISTLVCAFKIATDYKGFYPITWAVMIFVTAIILYAIMTTSLAILKLIWSFIRRIPRGSASNLLVMAVISTSSGIINPWNWTYVMQS